MVALIIYLFVLHPLSRRSSSKLREGLLILCLIGCHLQHAGRGVGDLDALEANAVPAAEVAADDAVGRASAGGVVEEVGAPSFEVQELVAGGAVGDAAALPVIASGHYAAGAPLPPVVVQMAGAGRGGGEGKDRQERRHGDECGGRGPASEGGSHVEISGGRGQSNAGNGLGVVRSALSLPASSTHFIYRAKQPLPCCHLPSS